MIKSKIKMILTLIIVVIVTAIAGLFVVTGIAFADSDSSDFKNGYGTAENPYKITNIEEFNNIRYHLGAYFEQVDNLDFNNSEFSPIGSVTFPFTGHYDGGKYQISNIHIKQNANNVGLFAFVDKGGEIENLKVFNSKIEGEYNIGAIVGTNRGTVVGCISAANISGDGAVGGIVGFNAVGGKTVECGNLGNISSARHGGIYFGGIVGVNNSSIQDCYNHGQINSDKNTEATYCGGIVGLNDGDSYNAEIDRCYNIGNVLGNARGQIAGDNLNGSITNCKWQSSELNKVASFDSGKISDAVVMDRNGFKSASSFNGWDFASTWRYLKNTCDYPLLNREYVEVKSVSFEQSNIELQAGKSVKLKTVVQPKHATESMSKLELSSNIAGVKLGSDNVLSVGKTVKPGTEINITAKTENKSAKLTVTVLKIPVESVQLINLDDTNEISRLQCLHFKGNAYPEDASCRKVEYRVDSSFAEITADGFLTIKENAPTGTKIAVTAVSADNPMKSDSIIVTVVKESVQSVTINSDNSFKATGMLKLSAIVLPEQATYKDVTYKIVSSTAEGATIINNVLTAKGLGTIIVTAEADGVKSEEFAVQVIKEPVNEIVWNTQDSITCGDVLVLNVSVVPDNATFSKVRFSIVGDNTAQAKVIDGILYAETAGKVIVRAIADEIVSDKEIIVEKISVESIELNFADSIKHTESLILAVKVLPENATNKGDIEYEIINDSADSKIIGGMLYANKPGTVMVKITVDGISAEKIITVLKEPVRSVSLNAAFCESDNGEIYQFTATIYPTNSTYQEVTYILKSGNATLSETGLLQISPSTPVGSLVEVYAVVDGIDSAVYQIKSGRIAVKNVSLKADAEKMQVGESVKLNTTTVPEIVSNPGVTYIIVGNAEIIDNVLYVFDTEAVGTAVDVTAVVDGVESNTISVRVVETPVENITFTCATSFKVTGSLKLTASVYPQNATDKTVTFTVISGKELGAEIMHGYLYVQKVGVVKVRATAADISRDLVVCVQKEPVTRIVFSSPLSVKINNTLKLTATAYPFNATFKDVSFDFIKNEIEAEIIDGNILFSSRVGKVTLRVIADEICEDIEIEIVKEPVTGLILSKTVFKHTESLDLNARVLPTNATYKEVSYSILNSYKEYEDIGGRIENGKLYADRPGLIKLLITTDNGNYIEVVDIEVTKEPVIGIAIVDIDEPLLLNCGYRIGQITLNPVIFPFNATYKDVDYEIIQSNNCRAELDKNVVTVTLLGLIKTKDGYAADVQASITVKAIADGVEFYKTYEFYKLDLKNENEIKLDTKNRTFKTSGQFGFNVLLPEKITYKGIRVEIINQGNTGAKFGHTDNNAPIVIDENFKENILLGAALPGTFTLKITSLCDGETIKEFEFTVEEEKINNVYLGIEGESKYFGSTLSDKQLTETANYSSVDISDYKLYNSMNLAQGEQLSLRAFANALDVSKFATYGKTQHLKIYYLDEYGNKQSANENNIYFTRKEETLTINKNAPVTAKIKLFAAFEGNNYDIKSDYIELTIESAYIKDIEQVSIDKDGLITGMNRNDYMKRVHIFIEHTLSDIVIEKTIETNDPHLQLNLYNKNLGGEFNITYKAFFEQQFGDKIYKYNYIFSNVTKFSGLKNSYITQEPNHVAYNSIALLDYYQNAKTVTEVASNVKVLYVYGNAYQNRIASFKFNCSADIYLDNFSFTSPTGVDAITIQNGNSINLFTKGDITIKAADGDSSNINGSNVIYGPNANLTILNNGKLKLISGFGYKGTDGISYSVTDYSGGSGRAASGGAGTRGGNGGIGIDVNKLIISELHSVIEIYGGNGGIGGTGGDGQGSDKDDRPRAGDGGLGGIGGNGGNGIVVSINLELNLNSNTIKVVAGNGGTGGNGGSGGYGKNDHYSDSGGYGANGGSGGNGGVAIVSTYINANGGTANLIAQSGTGGDGGRGGNGGNAWYNYGKPTKGYGGDGGRGGNSGNGIQTNNYYYIESLNLSVTVGAAGNGGIQGQNGGGGDAHEATRTPVPGSRGSIGSKFCS